MFPFLIGALALGGLTFIGNSLYKMWQDYNDDQEAATGQSNQAADTIESVVSSATGGTDMLTVGYGDNGVSLGAGLDGEEITVIPAVPQATPAPPPSYDPNANAPDEDHTFDPAIADQLTGVVDNMDITDNSPGQGGAGSGPQQGGQGQGGVTSYPQGNDPGDTDQGNDPGDYDLSNYPTPEAPNSTPGIGGDNGEVEVNGQPAVVPEVENNTDYLDDALYALLPGGASIVSPANNIAGGSKVNTADKNKKTETDDNIDWAGFALDAGTSAAEIVGAWMQNAETQADVTSQLDDTVEDLDTQATQATEDYTTDSTRIGEDYTKLGTDLETDYINNTNKLTKEEQLAKEDIDRQAVQSTSDVNDEIADVTTEETIADNNAAGELAGFEGGTAEALRAEATRLHKQAKADLEAKKTRITDDATYEKGVISGKVAEAIAELADAKTKTLGDAEIAKKRALEDAEKKKNRVVDYTTTEKQRATEDAKKIKDRSTTNALGSTVVSLLGFLNKGYSKKGYKK